MAGSRITVIRMTTITFKLDDVDARRLRKAAEREHSSVSEFLRRRVRESVADVEPIRRVTCRHTGAGVFKPSGDEAALTTADVKASLRDFP